jgi:hypothetical protein
MVLSARLEDRLLVLLLRRELRNGWAFLDGSARVGSGFNGGGFGDAGLAVGVVGVKVRLWSCAEKAAAAWMVGFWRLPVFAPAVQFVKPSRVATWQFGEAFP